MSRVYQRAYWIVPWLLLSTGCAPTLPRFYTMPIRQGNFIDPAVVTQLRPGMTRSQVQQLMGTPLVAHPFQPHRWEYYYQYTQHEGTQEQRKLTLIFRGETLEQVLQ